MSSFLPQSTVRLLAAVPDHDRHPGLQLDKFSIPGNQEAQKRALDMVCRIRGDSVLLAGLSERRKRILASLPGATGFRCTTAGPLTLHLSRASALENAGICLHPLYGFAYLPCSGLKGMARAYAETVWLPAQDDSQEAWRQIEDVFGWAPNPDRKQQIRNPNHPAALRHQNEQDPKSAEVKASSGMVVFHDAWPTAWPPLIVDIVNNHHPHYYPGQAGKLDNQGRCSECKFAPDDPNAHPPGDWENPVPVYFLTVKPGTTFDFPLSKRRADVPHDLLNLACQWLLGALCHLGAGAKTNAGYGSFKASDSIEQSIKERTDETWSAATSGSNPKRAVFETRLELVTPAFLAGAEQYRAAAVEGCDLRPATLRGHLRWWWRTMHAGFVDVRTLRALEAAIWGDTRVGGAVRAELSPRNGGRVSLYSHPKDRASGTRYVAYGMDETSRRQRRQRFRLDPPATWCLRLIARATDFFVNREDIGDPKKAQSWRPLTAIQVLDQAKAALWLLSSYGGVGSRGRKGFGSLAARGLDGFDLNRCKSIACRVRQQCSIDKPFSPDQAESPSISDPDLYDIEIPVQASADEVIDRVGRAYSAVSARFKHNVDRHNRVQSPNKGAWGLPRKIHGPRDDGPIRRRDGSNVQNSETWQPPEWLDFPKRPSKVGPQNARHASPVHVHVAKNPSGGFTVRMLAMPAKYLTSRAESVKMLRVFVESFRAKFDAAPARPTTGRHRAAAPPAPRSATGGPAKRPFGTPVRVQILAERPKGGYDVREEGHSQGTLTVGSPPIPRPGIGDTVDAVVHDDDPKRPQYRWPDSDTKTKGQPKAGHSSGPGPKRRGRWR